VAFHECGFSIHTGWFIRPVLLEYGLQLQHLNPNSIQQMVAFEAPCEGYLGMGARQQGGDILLPTPCFIRRFAQPIVTGILPSFRTTPSTCC
jgi:hypothetical protein